MKTRVIVQLNISLHIQDTWGEDSSIGQVRNQAAKAARARVSQILVPSDRDVFTSMEVVSITLGDSEAG